MMWWLHVAHAVIAWARSSCGLYTQAAVAFVFQCVGVGIVIAEIRDGRRNVDELKRTFRAIEAARREAQAEVAASNPAREPTAGTWTSMEEWATDAAAALNAPHLHAYAALNALDAKIGELADQLNEFREHPYRPWVGAALLFLGILVAFTGALSGVH
jgi:hypothetical protein